MKFKFFWEKNRLRVFKRYKELKSNILGFPISMVDKSSFISMYDEIFNKEIYKFNSNNKKPKIIDCGANIGLSLFYFKKIYPESIITAFEPDRKIFEILKKNVISSKFNNIDLINKGLAEKNEEQVSFFSEGADGGRIALEMDKKTLTNVSVTRLSPFLEQPVDFLKIDIEGAEIEVLRECQKNLRNVNNLFIEYHSIVDKKQKLDEILKILTINNFRYYINRTGIKTKHPFLKLKNHLGYDLQLNISAKKYENT